MGKRGDECSLAEPLRGLQENRVATREENGVLGFPSPDAGALAGLQAVSGSWDQEVMERQLIEELNSDICGFLSILGIWYCPLEQLPGQLWGPAGRGEGIPR